MNNAHSDNADIDRPEPERTPEAFGGENGGLMPRSKPMSKRGASRGQSWLGWDRAVRHGFEPVTPERWRSRKGQTAYGAARARAASRYGCSESLHLRIGDIDGAFAILKPSVEKSQG